MTPGFKLPNPYIIHAREASYINDDHPERYLDLAVGQTLWVAKEAGIKSMAMPAIGTGVFKFPPELAAEINLKALLSRAAEHPEITIVQSFCEKQGCMRNAGGRDSKCPQTGV